MHQRDKNIFKKIFSSQVVLTIIGLLIIVFISIPLAKNVSKQYKFNKEIDNLKAEIGGLENKNSQLKNLISYLESDQFVDEKARLNLNYKKVGENVVVIKDQGEEASSDNKKNIDYSQLKDDLADDKESNFQKWIFYFLSTSK